MVEERNQKEEEYSEDEPFFSLSFNDDYVLVIDNVVDDEHDELYRRWQWW